MKKKKEIIEKTLDSKTLNKIIILFVGQYTF
jgi:hypothetical protein